MGAPYLQEMGVFMSKEMCVFMFNDISFLDGSIGTKWGPCSCGGKDPRSCPQCQHAEELDRLGLDFSEAYEKARKNKFRD